MRYFCVFNDEGERTMTLVADGMPYTVNDIITRHPEAIEVTEEEQALYMQGYVLGKNGMPQKKEIDLTLLKEQKKESINYIARVKLMETDHDYIEHMEINNLDNEDFKKLKAYRNTIRKYRDELLEAINNATSVQELNQISFSMN